MRGRDEPAQLDGVARRHRVAQRPAHREANAAEMEQGGVHLEPAGDLPDTVVEHGIAGDPQDAVLLAVPAQREADHVADDEVGVRRPVPTRRRRDLEVCPPRVRQPRRLPVRQPAGRSAEAPGAGARRHHGTGRRQQRAAAVVEVVGVVVVAEQHRVDAPEAGGGQRRAGELARRGAPAEVVPPAGGVERRVGQQAPAGGLDEDGRTADVGEADALHALLGAAVCSSAHATA